MPILRIQHSVPTYDGWKQAFDSDPVARKGGGVRRYQVYRSVQDPNFVMIDLEFDELDKAQEFLQRLRNLWSGPGQAVMQNPEAWIVEKVESTDIV